MSFAQHRNRSFRTLFTSTPAIAALQHLGLLAVLAISACEGEPGADAGATDTDSPFDTDWTGGGTGDTDTDTDADSSDSTDGSSGDEPNVPNCGESHLALEVAPSRVMLVLDKSGSMAANSWDHDGDPTTGEIPRWTSLHATVDVVTSSFGGSIEFGALLYPSIGATSSYDANACWVADSPEILPAPDNAAAIMDALPGPWQTDVIQGGTPSAAAVTVALQTLRDGDDGGRQAILFITDGEANCRADAEVGPELFEIYDHSLHTVVEDAWSDEGIPTYVVGIAIRDQMLPNTVDGSPDGINPHEQLQLLAQQGGRPRADGPTQYYAANDQVELENALAEIAAEQFDCTVAIEPVPEHPDYVQFELGGERIEQVQDCADGDGWRWTSADGPYDRIQLCGGACEAVAAEGLLDATYGCPPPP
ncbi:vWA domain-containing protein [Paraliomyxa miuraensis]|uniref:vWA domain-containing protein n=1 Tax=Paraliomyxa miuraensis TaxID=376150 RepID=UPI00224E091C|nr:vWA domain-containing protein [Paraliomyxa miuraensis]MCX4240619.1 hypothetical protein [Paraliomyxa miuraensis]